MGRSPGGLPRERTQPRLAARDATAEAVAGIVPRPGRAAATMLGTVPGVGAFVAVLGLTATGAGQISPPLTLPEGHTAAGEDNRPAHNRAPPATNPPPRLVRRPALVVDGIAYTVTGIYSAAQGVVTDESAMLIPENTALGDFGNPQPGIGNQDEA